MADRRDVRDADGHHPVKGDAQGPLREDDGRQRLGSGHSKATSTAKPGTAKRGTRLAWWLDSRLLPARIRNRIPLSARRWRKRRSIAAERAIGGAAAAAELADIMVDRRAEPS